VFSILKKYGVKEYNLLMHHPMITLEEIKLTMSAPMDIYETQNLKW